MLHVSLCAGVSVPGATLHPPPSTTQTISSLATLQSDIRFSSNTTLSSIWDIEVS